MSRLTVSKHCSTIIVYVRSTSITGSLMTHKSCLTNCIECSRIIACLSLLNSYHWEKPAHAGVAQTGRLIKSVSSIYWILLPRQST